MERSEAVALIEKRRDAWVNQDLETYLGLTAEDYELEVNGHEELRGRLAFEQMIRRNDERFLPISWTSTRLCRTARTFSLSGRSRWKRRQQAFAGQSRA